MNDRTMPKNLPCISTLYKLLICDPEKGTLVWRARGIASWDARYSGKQAFTANTELGYKVGNIFGRRYRAHRVIWAMTFGDWPTKEIDHINGDPADNRIVNLREVTSRENKMNMKARKGTRSGVMGVYPLKRTSGSSKKWAARIRVNDEEIYLGSFYEKSEAIGARRRAERKFGFHDNHGR